LLLVMEAKLDEEGERGIVAPALDQLDHRVVDAGPEVADLRRRRSAQEPAPRTAVHFADRVVIGVEKVMVALVDGPIARQVLEQTEALEKPRYVREVPL